MDGKDVKKTIDIYREASEYVEKNWVELSSRINTGPLVQRQMELAVILTNFAANVVVTK